MPTEHIVALLIEERDKLNQAIEALGGTNTRRRGRPRKNPTGEAGVAVAPGAVPTKKHHMRTLAARKAQAQRMREYWKRKKRLGK